MSKFDAHMDGATIIAAERKRQIEAEGWTPEHDDTHTEFELTRAARCYAVPFPTGHTVPPEWPWSPLWWKPSPDRIKNLARAGALIAAEIDRLKRECGN